MRVQHELPKVTSYLSTMATQLCLSGSCESIDNKLDYCSCLTILDGARAILPKRKTNTGIHNMTTLTNKQQASFDTGSAAFENFEFADSADAIFTDDMRSIVATKANSFERKGFEASALEYCVRHQVKGDKGLITGSPEVKRLRAKLAKVETGKGKQNWTIKFGTDGKTGVANAAHLQRSTSAIAKKAIKSSKDVAIKGVKDLDALLDYAIENYGLKAVVSNITARTKPEHFDVA